MKQLQKMLALTLAILLLISVLPAQAMAADDIMPAAVKASGTCGANLTWTVSDSGTLTISGTGPMTDYEVRIDFSNNKEYATHPWREWSDSIQKVVIEKGVTAIGQAAFFRMANVTSVTIPATVTSLGWGAFYRCTGLTSVTIPGSVKNMAEEVFSGCTSLKSVTLANGVTMISRDAFQSCESLTTVSIPNTVKTIGRSAFSSCSSLKEITLPEGLTKIETLTFQYCSSLEKIAIPETVKHIETLAFQDCTSLTSITIPASVISIGDAGSDMIERGLTFVGCYGLTEVRFEGSAPEFVGNVFWGVGTKAYYPDDNPTWTEDVMQDYGGKIDWVSYASDRPIPAKPYKITNVVSGIHVYWNKIDGISKYGVWRSETGADGTYKWIANPTVPHFTDTTAKSGTTYYYRITSVSPSTGKHSVKSEARGITYVSTPDITSRANTDQGIQLGWDKIPGATGYAIYRKVGANDWSRVATIDGGANLSWVDTAVKSGNGVTYKYTIRALYGTTLSGCRNTGRTMVRLLTPTVSTCVPHATVSGCAFVRWSENNRATGYEVRFLLNGAVCKTYTIGNNQTVARRFEGLKAGSTYTVQVRSYYKTPSTGTYYSAWSTAKSVTL